MGAAACAPMQAHFRRPLVSDLRRRQLQNFRNAHCKHLPTVKNSRSHHWTGTDLGAAPRRTARSRKQHFAHLRHWGKVKNGNGSIARDALMRVARAHYCPPNGFFTISLLVTDITPGTPFEISATLSVCAASATVPSSVTAPSFAMTLMLPASISLCFTMAA
jgi:hypothetical protein